MTLKLYQLPCRGLSVSLWHERAGARKRVIFTLRQSVGWVLGKLDLPTSPVLGSRVRVRPTVLSLVLTTSRPRHVRLKIFR